MSRSIWKPPFSPNLSKTKYSNRSTFKANSLTTHQQIWTRGAMVLPEHIGKEYRIYNGKTFSNVIVSRDMVNHKWGEFVSTRKNPRHKLNKSKQMSRKKRGG